MEVAEPQEYRLIFGNNLDVFNQKVTALLAEGWQLYGNPFERESTPEGFMQAMVKAGPQEPPKQRATRPVLARRPTP